MGDGIEQLLVYWLVVDGMCVRSKFVPCHSPCCSLGQETTVIAQYWLVQRTKLSMI